MATKIMNKVLEEWDDEENTVHLSIVGGTITGPGPAEEVFDTEKEAAEYLRQLVKKYKDEGVRYYLHGDTTREAMKQALNS